MVWDIVEDTAEDVVVGQLVERSRVREACKFLSSICFPTNKERGGKSKTYGAAYTKQMVTMNLIKLL